MINLNRKRKLAADVVISAAMLLVFAFNLLAYPEYKLQDAAFQRPDRNYLPSPYITVFGIDSGTLDFFAGEGRFADWNRQRVADAIYRLNNCRCEWCADDDDEVWRPAVIAVDIMYTVPSANHEADAALVRAAADGGNVVLASFARYGDIFYDGEFAGTRRAVVEHETPFAALAEYAAYGAVNAEPSHVDWLIRYAFLTHEYNGGTIYSFPVEIYRMYMQYIGEEDAGVEGFIAANNIAYIRYYGPPGTFSPEAVAGARLSFADIFADDFQACRYAGGIILIGAYAPGFGDAYFTPVSRDQMYGVEILANIVNMLIDGNLKQNAPRGVNFAVLVIFILLAVVLAKLMDIRILLAVLVAAGAGYYFLALLVFDSGYILTLVYPLVAMAVIYIYQVVYAYISEAAEKLKLKSAFRKYVDPQLADRLVGSGEADSNEVGVQKNIAVMFVDVRGFTPMSEALKDRPQLVVSILNEYLELAAGTVFKNDGSVDKFVGDATMALFNGFFRTEDYVYKAVKAAWEMVQGAYAINADIKARYGVDVGFGIGVNCGDAVVGNLGPSFRKDYTAIGDIVNTASRLEGNAKASQILISADVYEQVKDRVEADSIGMVSLKGKSADMEVFAVKGLS